MGSIHPVQLLNSARPHGTNTEDFGILLSSRIDSSKTDVGVLLAFLNLLRYAGPFKAIVILGEDDTVFAKADRLQWSSGSIRTLLCFRFGTRVMVALVLINPFTAEAGEYEFIVGDCSGSITLESP